MELRAASVTLNRGSRAIVSKVDLAVKESELVGLIGPNGAGKSTLLGMLGGLLICDAGEIYLGDTPLSKISIGSRARTIGFVEQSGPVNWPLTVERIIALGRRPHLSTWQKMNDEDYDAINRAIVATDCDHLRLQDATTLSGGERTRMMLARALAAQPTILLADEPIATLDLGHQLQTMELLRSFAMQHRSCIVVLHDLSLAARYCDRLYLMKEGSMVAEGAPSDVLSAKNLEAVYEVVVESGSGSVPWIVPVRRLQQ